MADFILPNLGDGVSQGDVLKVLVKVGDTIKVDQPIVELETDKATIEVPSDVAGTVKEVKVKAGDKLKPGQIVLVMENGATGATSANVPAPAPAPEAPAASAAPAERPKVVDIAAGRPAAPAATAATPTIASVVTAAPAAPSVRRLAREIGVDVSQVTGTGPGGRITQEDVKEFAKRVMNSFGSGGQAAAASRPAGSGPALPDFSKWGEVERKAMSGIRRKTAEHLSHAWNTIPHVTQFDKADITNLEAMRKKYRGEAEKAGGNLTVTAVAVKVVATALRVFPQFNASVDAAGEAIVYKKYINIGIAVDTAGGLLVPVIRNADQKNLIQLSVDINVLAEKAKARKLTLDDMSGGSMSISNLGGIGGTSFTPLARRLRAGVERHGVRAAADAAALAQL